VVPFAQPDRALGLFRSFADGQRLPNTTDPSTGWLVADGWCWFVLREKYY
jgi:hypothetical protein